MAALAVISEPNPGMALVEGVRRGQAVGGAMLASERAIVARIGKVEGEELTVSARRP